MKNKKISNMVLFSMFLGIEVLMSFTPIGFLRIGFLSVTMLHIPVIVCAMVLGKKYGAALGFVMGFISFYNATLNPSITSFVFTPFYSIGNVSGNFYSLLIAFIPRILIGYFAGAIYQKFKNRNSKIGAILAGFCGTSINTIGVLGGIYIFFKSAYEAILGKQIITLFLSTIWINALSEVIIAIIIAMALDQIVKYYIAK